MGLFGLLNYEDYILNTLVKSNYARNGLIVLLIYIITGLVRFHLSIIICFIFTWNNAFDLISPIIITVLLSMASDTLFKYVETHRPWHESVVDYIMNNYSRENFIRWKRIILMILCCYILLAITLITIDNYFIFITTIQTAISFGICDLLEQKMPQTWYNRLMGWWHRPRVVKFSNNPDDTVIDNYFQQLIPDHQSKLSTELIPKPKRPSKRSIRNRRRNKLTNSDSSIPSHVDGGFITTEDYDTSKDSILTTDQDNNSSFNNFISTQGTSHLNTLNNLNNFTQDTTLVSPIPLRPSSPPKLPIETYNISDVFILNNPQYRIETVSPIPTKPPTPPLQHNISDIYVSQ
jgi:hypothetical protein